MKSALSILLVCVTLNLGLIAQVNPNPSSSVDNFIQEEMDNERFPGVSTVIVKDGQVVWMESYGFADIENNIPVVDTTVFLLASLSKVFTGTAIMQLHELEALDLDDDINNFLPWSAAIPGFEDEAITFRQLMTHSSSIIDNYEVMDNYYDYPDPTISLADCMQGYYSTTGSDYNQSNNFLGEAPGTAYEYSNIATALNGYLAEVISGMPFDQYCNNSIFDPLSMTKTAWYMADFDSTHVARPYQYASGNYSPYPHYGFADYPDGQLRSNVVDLSHYMMAYLNGGSFESNSILSAYSINEMWREQIPEIENGQGLNWYQEELYHSNGTTALWGHNGGEDGASTDMYLDSVNNIGICVLTNGEGDAISICDELYDYALTLTVTSNPVLENSTFQVSLNAANNSLIVTTMPGDYSIKILNLKGQLYKSIKTSGNATIDIAHLPIGPVLVSIRDHSIDEVVVQKILKQF